MIFIPVSANKHIWGLAQRVVSKGEVSENMLLQVVSVLQQCCLPCCFENKSSILKTPPMKQPLTQVPSIPFMPAWAMQSSSKDSSPAPDLVL